MVVRESRSLRRLPTSYDCRVLVAVAIVKKQVKEQVREYIEEQVNLEGQGVSKVRLKAAERIRELMRFRECAPKV